MSFLLPFVFRTIRKRTVDPGNSRFFLPVVLQNADGNNSQGKLIPVEESYWDVGQITGDGGATVSKAFIDNWASYLETAEGTDLSRQYPIADPSTPNPVLTMGNDDGKHKIVINGLQNVYAGENPAFEQFQSGYRITTTLQVGYWDGKDGRPPYPVLSLGGGYRLRQKLCLANTGSQQPNGNGSTEINGSGTVMIEVQNASIDTVFTVTTKSSPNGARQLVVKIEKLTFRGADEKNPPSLSVKALEIGADVSDFLIDIWKEAARNAIESPDGSAGIFQNINTALNQPGNLGPLSDELSQKLATAVDGLLGPLDKIMAAIHPASVNPVDAYMFDRVRYGLNSEGNLLFLPQLLCQNSSPSLNPLKVDVINLPPIKVLNLDLNDVKLENLVFFGLTNVKAPADSIKFDAQEVLSFTGILGGWVPSPRVSCAGGIPPPPATGDSKFSVTPKGSKALTGKLGLKIDGVQVIGSARASGPDDSSLEIEITSLRMAAPDLAKAIKVNLDIESAFKAIINNAINTPNMLQKIFDEINGELARQLPGLSAEVTKYAREAVKSGLK